MSKSIVIPLVCAILGPFIEGIMNTTDKYVLTHKVKRPLSYAIVAGVVNLFIGIVVALCLNWSGVTSYREILFPALAGAIFGTQFLIYYQLLSKEDVSTVIGLLYLYPIVVAILSYIFLAEKFTLLTYIGMGLIMFGGVRLSGRVAVFNIRFGLLIAMLILLVALHEFFIKVATNSLPAINGLSISMITMGLTIFTGLFNKETRQGVLAEFKNLKWAAFCQTLTFMGMGAIYFAMAGLPATIVSTIAATQPLTVLLLEKAFHKCGVQICSDELLLPKLIPITAIVAGIFMLYGVV